ncbi:MAG TPA: BrnA antitoxin family protein [Janthinobacterium sp.]|jgi:uncharacterized protein (DUF4415 family)|nr:BrnA antitoxin family protein [Janthinobacterium sp.]
MKASPDQEHDESKIANMTSVNALKTGALRRMQENTGLKSRITMRVDSDVLDMFRTRAAMSGGNYQTLMNDALRQYALGQTLAGILDASVREAVDACLQERADGLPRQA